jgi:acetyl esterase
MPAGGVAALGVDGVRALGVQMDAQAPRGAQVSRVSEHLVGGQYGQIRLRLYKPNSTKPLPLLVYIHGGGWTMGSIDGGVDHLCRDIVRMNGIAVASIDYRLAPENKFPIPVDECHAALKWLRSEAVSLGLDTSRIAVAGDSAGGNIAAVLSHLDKGEKTNRIAAQVLLYPVTEYKVERPSWTDDSRASVLSRHDVSWFWDQYLRSEADQAEPRATPANFESFEDLPPALIVVAGYDPLRDDGLHYAELLKRSGTPCDVAMFEGSFHGFMMMPALAAYSRGLASISKFLDGTIGF